MALAYPLINGHRYGFSSIEFKLRGRIYLGVKEISYKDALEVAKIHGTPQQPIGRTPGKYSAEASCVMYREESEVLQADLQAAADELGLGGYGLVSFDAVVQYGETGMDTVTHELVGLRLVDIDTANSEGPDALEDTLTLDIMYVRRNGRTMFRPIEGISTE